MQPFPLGSNRREVRVLARLPIHPRGDSKKRSAGFSNLRSQNLERGLFSFFAGAFYSFCAFEIAFRAGPKALSPVTASTYNHKKS